MTVHSGPRVAILIPSISGGGAEFVAKEWATWLSEHAVCVDVLTTLEIDGNSVLDSSGFNLRFLRGNGFFGKARSLRRIAAEESYDAVISLMPYWNLMALSLVLRVRSKRPRLLISSRNSESSLGNALSWKFRLLTAIARRTYRYADGLIAISHPVAAEVIANYGVRPGRVWVVPNPATAKFDRVGNRERERPAYSENASTEVIKLVVPARVVEQKRPWLAVEVAALLGKTHSVELHFFGTGNLSSSIAELGREAGVETVMHGWVDSWFEEAPVSAVVLLPSLAEGFGNVLVEACAAGFPAVASSRALGVADAIVPGLTGILVAGDSAQEYADGVLAAIHCDLSGAKAWLARFSADSSGFALCRVLESVSPEVFVALRSGLKTS